MLMRILKIFHFAITGWFYMHTHTCSLTPLFKFSIFSLLWVFFFFLSPYSVSEQSMLKFPILVIDFSISPQSLIVFA